MKEVVLVFPDTRSMTDFIFTHKVLYSDVNTVTQTLSATMSDQDVAIACTEFQAELEVLKPRELD